MTTFRDTLQLNVGTDRLHVNVWSDKDCVGDLRHQASFVLSRVDGLYIDDAHYTAKTVLYVLVNGNSFRFEGMADNEFYEAFLDAIDAIGPRQEVTA